MVVNINKMSFKKKLKPHKSGLWNNGTHPFMVQKYPSYSLIVHVFCFTSNLLFVFTELCLNLTKKGKTY